MKKIATYLILFFITHTMVCGQSVIPKSLRSLLESPNDTHKVNQIIEQARMYTPGILQLGDELSDSALVVAREIGYLPGLIQAYRTKAQVATFQGDLDRAVSHYDQSLALCGQDPKFKRNRISMVLSKGIVYYLEGDMDQALVLYGQAEASCDEPQFDDLLQKAYNNMALAYRKLENYEDAVSVYQKILPLKEALEDDIGIATTYNNIGVSYAFLDDHERSLGYLEKAKAIFEQAGQWDHVQNIELSEASSLYELGKKEEAKAILITAFEYGDMNIPFYDLMQGKLLFAKLWLEEEAFDKANDLLQQLDPRIETTPYLADLQNYLLLRATASHGLKNNEDAYQYLQEFDFLRDTLVDLQRQKLEKTMEDKYLTREKVDKIALQLAQLERNSKERLIYIIGVIALLGIMGLGYALYRYRQKANQLLSLKNSQIEKSLEEKEILLKEIHHRVKNNLQIISSLLNLQSRQIKDPKALEAIQEGRNRVASMALIHKNLYQEDNLVGVNAADYIDKLTDSLMASYQVSEQKVSFEKDIDPVQLDVDVVIPLGLILNEVITNCLKYAFDEEDKGLIQMSLKEKTEGLRLRVEDNGKGLPIGFDVEQLSSLGFRLIKAFTNKLEAGLTISSVAGTQIEVFIPKHKLS